MCIPYFLGIQSNIGAGRVCWLHVPANLPMRAAEAVTASNLIKYI
jgi:hypothetical protein